MYFFTNYVMEFARIFSLRVEAIKFNVVIKGPRTFYMSLVNQT
jgi:hypothetical protein